MRLITNKHYPGSLMKKATSLSIPIANLKFPPVTTLSFSSARSKDWEDVVTGHTDESFARTWSVLNKKLGRWTFGTADKGKAGSVKVHFQLNMSKIKLTFHFVLSGRLRQCMWQFWPCGFFYWCDPNVEHAIRYQA